MKNDRKAWLKKNEQDRKQWVDDHRSWRNAFQRMKRCEQRLMGLIFEMEETLPSHRAQVNKLQDIITEHEDFLSIYSTDIPCREKRIDDRCPTEFANLKQLGMSRCRTCEPKCFDVLQELHREADERHRMVSRQYEQIGAEFEASMKKMTRLAKELNTCLKDE